MGLTPGLLAALGCAHQGCLQPSVVEKAWERSSATVAMLVVLAEEKY